MNWMKFLQLVGGSIIDKPLEIIDNQLQFYQERQNAAQPQQLRQDEARFMQKLELDRQKFNAELDEMIADRAFERDKEILDTIKDYQITMAQSTASINASLSKMTVELRRQAHNLIQEKKQAYRQMQIDARNDMREQLKQIQEDFPEGSRARTIMEDAVAEQFAVIIENSRNFLKMIDADFIKITDNLDAISKSAREHTNQYISMTLGGLLSKQLRGGDDTKLIK